MRNLFLGAAAMMAMAAPGVASAQTGYVGLDYTNVDIDGADSQDAFGVSGSVALTGHVAIDAGVSDSDDSTAWGATGHLFQNDSQALYGVFAGVSDNDVSTTWAAGVEGQYYMNNVTWAGAISYANNDDADIDAWGVNGEGRYFINDNFRLEAGLGYFDLGGSADDSAITAGFGGEYQFAAAPVSVGLGYSHLEFDTADASADAVSATVRYNFGGGTLSDRDHSGAGLAGLSGIGSALGL